MKEKRKTFNIRIPHLLWVFLKTKAMKENTTMNQLLINSVEKMKNNKKSVEV